MAELSTQEKYKFKRTLEELKKKRGQGTELLSIYIPHDKQISDVTAQLKDEVGSASNIKSKSTRRNVQGALASVLSRLRYYRMPPENGLIIFCGAVRLSGDKTDMESIIMEPPEPVLSYSYQCSSEFYIEPLEEILKDKKTFELLVLDRKEAAVGLLVGKRIEALRHLTSNVPGKQRKGGQSAARFSRLRLIAINEFYKRIGEAASNVYLKGDWEDFRGIFIGGPSPTKEEFVKGEYLHYALQKKILGVFDVSYTDESGLYELVNKLSQSMDDMEIAKEKKLINRFMSEVIKENGLASYGEEFVRANLKAGAVDTLLLSEDLKMERIRRRCGNCGREETITIAADGDEQDNMVCKCGSTLEIIERRDIVEELSETAEASGTKVEMISTESEEGEQFFNAFGGIAAILRFRVGV
ncbi:MAG: peptide chain release factor 1 [Candidatus Methanolliviera hydrocarbonicum]|uniref:Peptide chain release factor subunit 1 n=1 Tax=Candidatus Methanolliviera hydrocarbonicum TaxID=2491085 RepID=A0A520KYA8_9EURY|nr:MAG: peptide chain release factor 1 [Candidatus Methanolliviera hydrocarbonicum]